MQKHIKKSGLFTSLIILILLSACSTKNVEPLDEITVQLKWVHQAQFAGFYCAVEEGYYAEENLAVTLLQGGIGIDPIETLVSEQANFSIAAADNIITRQSVGDPIKAIATTYRINPTIWVTLKGSGIASPEDFAGKSVVVSKQIDKHIFYAMIEHVGLDPADITLLDYTGDNSDFFSGKVDAIVSFVAGTYQTLKEEAGNRELNIIWPDDYGVHFYSDTIVTSDSMVNNDPDVVLRFLRATVKGYQCVIENPEQAIDHTMKYAGVQDRRIQSDMLYSSIPLFYTSRSPIGWMDASVWTHMQETLYSQGIIKELLPLEEIYTNRFVEQINEK